MLLNLLMIVGFMGGEVAGVGVEIIQWIGGRLGFGTGGSAFNRQDFYSNKIGSDFRDYMGRQRNNFDYDWTASFYYWIQRGYK